MLKKKRPPVNKSAPDRRMPDDEIFLQPWFVPKQTFLTMRKLLPNCQLMKFKYYFADYGCLKCEKKNQLYSSNGLCYRCNLIVRRRLVGALARRLRRLGNNVPDKPIRSYLKTAIAGPG